MCLHLRDAYYIHIAGLFNLQSGSKLFATKRKDAQRDEFTQALESERTRNRKLQDEVQDLKTELYQTKVSCKLCTLLLTQFLGLLDSLFKPIYREN